MDKYRNEVLQFQKLSAKLGEFFVYDTETTGLNAANDDIIEFSALHMKRVDGKWDAVDELDVFINIGRPLPEIITELTGITDEILQTEGIAAKDAAEKIATFLGENPMLVGYNSVSFDTPFVERLYQDQLSMSFNRVFQLDVLTMAREKTERPHKLVDMAEKAGLTGLQFHRSIDDCKATLGVLKYLLPMYKEEEPKESTSDLRILGVRRWQKSETLDRLYVTNSKNMSIYYDIIQKKWAVMGNVEDDQVVINAILAFAGTSNDEEFVKKYC